MITILLALIGYDDNKLVPCLEGSIWLGPEILIDSGDSFEEGGEIWMLARWAICTELILRCAPNRESDPTKQATFSRDFHSKFEILVPALDHSNHFESTLISFPKLLVETGRNLACRNLTAVLGKDLGRHRPRQIDK